MPTTKPRAAVLALVATVLLAGCDLSFAHLAGRATDEWTRTYQLDPGGTLRIRNTNGRIEVQGGEGSTIEVRAERIAKATTDEAARELLPRIKIGEDVKSDQVALETAPLGGIMIGASVEVRYYVKAPKATSFDLSATNGLVSLTGVTGRVIARTTNGAVTARNVTGAVDARTTNGAVNVDVAALGTQPLALRTTNGGVTLSLPDNAKADLSATWTNGGINVSGLKLDSVDRSRRSFTARMNGGGTPIELQTTNGGIRVRAHGQGSGAEPDVTDKQLHRYE